MTHIADIARALPFESESVSYQFDGGRQLFFTHDSDHKATVAAMRAAIAWLAANHPDRNARPITKGRDARKCWRLDDGYSVRSGVTVELTPEELHALLVHGGGRSYFRAPAKA